MLQRQAFQEQLPDEDHGQFLTPSHIFDLLRRRWLHFAIPFVLLSVAGGAVAMLWPATYLAEGKILVESPQIPSDLVRPTVAILANERVQIIEQRIMTRDNLLAVARKFNLTNDWRSRLSGTDLIDFIRQRTRIKPLELKLPNTTKGAQAIAFTVGFEHEQPVVATKVANELMTMILNEDVRGRTNSATETTRFLAQEAKRLEAQIASIDGQVAKIKRANAAAGEDSLAAPARSENEKQLMALKAELMIRSATLSAEHPDIKALKRRIEAFEAKVASTADDKQNAIDKQQTGDKANNASDALPKPIATAGQSADTQPPPATRTTGSAAVLDAMTTQKTNLNAELTGVTQKLAAARLGENLERGQYAERLQVIEQPSLPEKPVHPNRPKIFGFALAFALMASGGLIFAAETLNPAIRRSSDLYSIIDSHLVVSIPYITTLGETRRKKKKIIYATGVLTLVAVAGLIAVFFVLPPLDVLFAKITARLLG